MLHIVVTLEYKVEQVINRDNSSRDDTDKHYNELELQDSAQDIYLRQR